MLWGWCVVGVGESRGWVSRGGGHIKVVGTSRWCHAVIVQVKVPCCGGEQVKGAGNKLTGWAS